MSHEEGSELDRELVSGVPDDQTMEVQVKDAFAWESRLDVATIHVDVQEGSVRLSGQVPSENEKELADAIAWGVPGVTDVVNDLQVGEGSRRPA